jgi:hypothetical protein
MLKKLKNFNKHLKMLIYIKEKLMVFLELTTIDKALDLADTEISILAKRYGRTFPDRIEALKQTCY